MNSALENKLPKSNSQKCCLKYFNNFVFVFQYGHKIKFNLPYSCSNKKLREIYPGKEKALPGF